LSWRPLAATSRLRQLELPHFKLLQQVRAFLFALTMEPLRWRAEKLLWVLGSRTCTRLMLCT
jgi:hypothetical protein